MTRILGLDLESNGLSTATDAITELGVCLWDVEQKKPLKILNELINQEGVVISKEITELTGITKELLEEFGYSPVVVFDMLEALVKRHKPEYIIAHNAENFDKPMLFANMDRIDRNLWPEFRKIPWLDSRTDLPFEKEPTSRSLNHLAMEHGYINFFKHRAITDVLTMLKLVGMYDFTKVVEMSKIPWITVRALVDYENRELAKAQRFSWEKIGDKTYPKMWVKKIKQNTLEREVEKTEGKFKIVQIE